MNARRVVVIGGGVAGLLATAAAAQRDARVVLIERDAAPAEGLPRKSVPQGHHVHTLLMSGRAAIEELCPGAYDEVRAAGARQIDFCADVAFFHYGVWKPRCRSDFIGTFQTRPLLEQILWRRIRSLTNVTIQAGIVRRLVMSEDGRRVAGVDVSIHGAGVRRFPSDVVIDASGRGSRLPAWLSETGFAAPSEEEVRFDLRYASCFCSLQPDARRDWQALLIYPKAPFGRRAGYIFPVEGNRHLVTLTGYFGESPGTSFPDFLTFARTLARCELYDAIADADPLSAVQLLHLSAQYRRRYDLLQRMPEGLIAVGDAVCVLDPLFGQGMSVAARQALVLREHFERRGRPDPGGCLAAQRAIVRHTDVPWLLTSSEAFRYTETRGSRSPLFPLLQWYAARVFELSASDPAVYQAFMGLMHLVAPLSSVFRPRLGLTVLRKALFARHNGIELPGEMPVTSMAE